MCYVIIYFETGAEARHAMAAWRPYQIADAFALKTCPNLYELWVPIK